MIHYSYYYLVLIQLFPSLDSEILLTEHSLFTLFLQRGEQR